MEEHNPPQSIPEALGRLAGAVVHAAGLRTFALALLDEVRPVAPPPTPLETIFEVLEKLAPTILQAGLQLLARDAGMDDAAVRVPASRSWRSTQDSLDALRAMGAVQPAEASGVRYASGPLCSVTLEDGSFVVRLGGIERGRGTSVPEAFACAGLPLDLTAETLGAACCPPGACPAGDAPPAGAR